MVMYTARVIAQVHYKVIQVIEIVRLYETSEARRMHTKNIEEKNSKTMLKKKFGSKEEPTHSLSTSPDK